MQGITKRAIDGDALPPEEQEQGPKRPKVVKPFGHSVSPFQPWQPSWMKDLGIAQESNSAGKPCLQLGNSNSPVEQDENKMTIENSTPESDHTDKSPINGGGATSGVGDDGKAGQTDKDQTDPLAPGSGCNTQPEMDPKRLERIIANRASAQRSRMRKIEYVAGLEEKAKTYQNKINHLHPQIVACKHRQQLLQIEQHKLKLEMAIYEKERILQEVEIEKNKQDIKRLNELHKQVETEAREKMLNRSAHPMLNRSAVVQLMSNPNMNPFGLGPQFFLNSYQG
ncbi:Basic-leucine zipper domain [Sesbania bispinosa]|nr:Basic-leucine zipper domain [Sesbania bispinosa]